MIRDRLELLRARVSLLALAGQFTQMRHYSRVEHVGLCPLHRERHPSFFVNVETGRFYCHGCQAGGDVFRFVEILCACDFREAVRQVARIGKGKPLSLPAVGRFPIGAKGGVGGNGVPPTSEHAESSRAFWESNRGAIRAGAARALLARYEELPACMHADWDAAVG